MSHKWLELYPTKHVLPITISSRKDASCKILSLRVVCHMDKYKSTADTG